MANSHRRCTFCKKYQPTDEGVKHNAGFFCNNDHAYQYAMKKTKAANDKAFRAETVRLKKTIMTRSDWIKKTKTACHNYIRARDEGKQCVTCDTVLFQGGVGGGFDAGHYRDVGNSKHLEFHALNIFGQCKKCNNPAWGGHSKIVYRAEIVNRIGEDLVAKIDADNEPRKYTIQDFERLEVIFKRKLKLLKKQKVA
ncbi:MAG: recombination protein NinG [Thiomicrorhabdus sp.]|jgi:hypothetical protein|nr:recombination protein NinG [Thiomicrorhabdus sp.]